MSNTGLRPSPFPRTDADNDLSVARRWICGLPPLPSRIRYLDEYDDTIRDVAHPATAEIWHLQADTRSFPLKFARFQDAEVKSLAKHHAAWCLAEFSVATTARTHRSLYQLTIRYGSGWLLEILRLPIPQWVYKWEEVKSDLGTESDLFGLKSLLYFFCSASLGDWGDGRESFLRSLRWPKYQTGAAVLDGSAISSVREEMLIIAHLDLVSRRVENAETVPRVQLLAHCLLCICYEHGLRPVQIGRIDLANFRTYQGNDGHPVVHFTAFRAKKRQAADKTPFVRKIKREWAAPFVAWLHHRNQEFEAARRAPTPSDKAFPIPISEIITTVGDIVESVTGTRRTATDLRHSAAQRLVDAGATVEEVADFLGHSHMETSLVYFEASAAQGPNINKALAASPIYSRIVDVARNGYIDRAGLEVMEGEHQIGAVPHGIPVSGIGACNLGQSLCTLNPAMSCYTCRKFIPIDEADVHRQVLSDFRGVVRFFYDESRGEKQSPAYMQLRTTLDAVQHVIADLSVPSDEQSV